MSDDKTKKMIDDFKDKLPNCYVLNRRLKDLSSKVCKIFVFFGVRLIRPPFLCISVNQMEVPMNRLKKNA